MREESTKKEECPLCQVSEETITQLKKQGKEKYLLKKEAKERERLLELRQKRMKTIINALPGMPSGSPGIPGFKTKPFQIYSLLKGQVSQFLTF